MRTKMATLLLALALIAPLQAAEEIESPQSAALANAERIELGEGVSLPRPVFEQLAAREDGLQMIERMEQRAKEASAFSGVPQLVVIFVSVLLFFWSALFYFQRKHARLHRTIQLMVEKGLPVPVEILRAAENAESGPDAAAGTAVAPPMWASNLLWGGLLWLTIGVTGIVFLWLRHSDAWPWGFAAVVYGGMAIFTALRKREPR
ncbi:MAG: hypothetical protein ABI821_13740 [Pseudomonadota bacterium]